MPSPSTKDQPDQQKIKNTCVLRKLKCPSFLNIKSLFSIFSKSTKDTKVETGFYKLIEELQQNIPNLSAREQDLISNFLRFRYKIIEDVMIPRSDVVAVSESVSLDELNDVIVKLAHTRILVYRETLDRIIGFIHTKDLFKVMTEKQPFELQKLIRKAIIATHSMKLSDLLSEMQNKHIHIAVVVDEYGGTDGIVTIEDIMEEIVGRIDDEHDSDDSDDYKVIGPNTILCNARVEVEVIESLLKINLKNAEDEFDTIGGLVLAKVGTVPLPGTIVSISQNVAIEVTDASPRVLKQVKIQLKNAEPLLKADTA